MCSFRKIMNSLFRAVASDIAHRGQFDYFWLAMHGSPFDYFSCRCAAGRHLLEIRRVHAHHNVQPLVASDVEANHCWAAPSGRYSPYLCLPCSDFTPLQQRYRVTWKTVSTGWQEPACCCWPFFCSNPLHSLSRAGQQLFYWPFLSLISDKSRAGQLEPGRKTQPARI